MLVCLEGLNLSHLMADLPWIDRVARAFSLAAHPDSLDTGKGPLMPFHEGIPPFVPIRELVGAPPVGVGGSVSTVAYSIAEQFGCDPIIFVGQDLAYTGGKTHATGTPFGGSTATPSRRPGRSYTRGRKRCWRSQTLSTERAELKDSLFEVPAWGGTGEVPTNGSSAPSVNGSRSPRYGSRRWNPGRRLINGRRGVTNRRVRRTNAT